MSKEPQLAVVDFGPADLKTLEDISTQVGACRTASEQKAGFGRTQGGVLSVFLKMVDEKLSAFVKELRERMKAGRTF